MDVELFEKDKPITVSNFLAYVQSGRFKDSFIHRCDPSFVIQGGGFWVANRGTANAGLAFIDILPPIRNEYGSGNVFSNRYGTIAMAQQPGKTNSATSQWFFNLGDNFVLDNHTFGNYFTVFGRVVRGTNVLNTFRTFQRSQGRNNEINTIADYSIPFQLSAFSEMPLLGPGTNITENTIVYVDISLLNVQVKKTNNVPEISWNSVAGKTNRVEFTTSMPPVWNTLLTTNGSGNRIAITDPVAAPGRRFYRVSLDY